MMKREIYNTLIFLASSLCFFSCANKSEEKKAVKDIEMVSIDSAGILQQIYYKDSRGKKQGKCYTFFKDGMLKQITNYKNDSLVGFGFFYDENGNLKEQLRSYYYGKGFGRGLEEYIVYNNNLLYDSSRFVNLNISYDNQSVLIIYSVNTPNVDSISINAGEYKSFLILGSKMIDTLTIQKENVKENSSLLLVFDLYKLGSDRKIKSQTQIHKRIANSKNHRLKFKVID